MWCSSKHFTFHPHIWRIFIPDEFVKWRIIKLIADIMISYNKKETSARSVLLQQFQILEMLLYIFITSHYVFLFTPSPKKLWIHSKENMVIVLQYLHLTLNEYIFLLPLSHASAFNVRHHVWEKISKMPHMIDKKFYNHTNLPIEFWNLHGKTWNWKFHSFELFM